MSLITCCPACATMFKVVPDQLKISQGWVRCGHCGEIFDATAQLKNEEEEEVAASHQLALPKGATRNSSTELDTSSSSPNTQLDETLAFEEPDSEQFKAEVLALVKNPLDSPFEFRRQAVVEDFRSTQSESEFQPELDDVSFVRAARRKAVWARPAVGAALWLMLFALGIVLVLQVVVHERDRLVAAAPALRPWLAKLCEPLHCLIGPLRQIDALVVDSSSFNKLRGDAYRLIVIVRNQTAIPVAMPALELTLTDNQDQPLVRRVLMPAEFGPHLEVIAATAEWSGSIALAVAANGTSGRIAGYRLLAFYP